MSRLYVRRERIGWRGIFRRCRRLRCYDGAPRLADELGHHLVDEATSRVATLPRRERRKKKTDMRVLIIGGTRFTGPFTVRALVTAGHDVTVFHRGEHAGDLPENVTRIRGDRHDM